MIDKRSNQEIIGIALVISIICISPLLPALGLPAGVIYISIVGVAILLNARKKKLKPSALVTILIIYAICLLPAIYWNSLQKAVEPAYLIISLILALMLSKNDFQTSVKYLSKFHGILLAGGVISFVYVLIGGSSLLEIYAPDGREIYILPFSLTNSLWSGFTRPSGVYDEPGTFSFFICAVVTLRHMLGFDEKKSLNMLLFGLVTLSLAHIIFLFVFMFSISKRFSKLLFMLPSAFFAGLIIFLSGNWALFYAVFLIRFKIDPDGTLHGDNRSGAFFKSMEILREYPEKLIWGISDHYRNNPTLFSEQFADGAEIGGNPLNQLLQNGIGSLPYFIILFSLFFLALRNGRRNIVLLAFGLLLLQRDYVYVISYSLVVSLILVAAYRRTEFV